MKLWFFSNIYQKDSKQEINTDKTTTRKDLEATFKKKEKGNLWIYLVTVLQVSLTTTKRSQISFHSFKKVFEFIQVIF